MTQTPLTPPVARAAAAGLHTLTATEAGRLLRSGGASAVELLEACLGQIARLDDWVHAWEHLAPEQARAQALKVDRRHAIDSPTGALAGIPVGVKDVFNTEDMPTQMGSPIWKGFTPGNDARVVHCLRMEDAVLPGKTVTAEFAVHAPGATRNPHDPRYMPGTSSSGSAAAVAACMVPIALGTQTGGSIMRPASYCGVYGFKPSFGLIPRTGMLKTTDSLDTVGFFARGVEDLAMVLDVARVRGRDHPKNEAALGDVGRQTKGDRPWRIALVQGPKWDDAEAYARTALLEFAGRLGKQAGFTVDEVEPPALDAAHAAHATIYDRTLAYYFKDEFRERTLISHVIYEIIERGNRISLDAYRSALDAQQCIARDFDTFMQQYDAVLTLTTGGAALQGLDSPDRPDNCLVWTLCGAPVINLPVFATSEGLPFGAQVVGRRYNDLLLLNLVRALREDGLVSDGTFPIPAAVQA